MLLCHTQTQPLCASTPCRAPDTAAVKEGPAVGRHTPHGVPVASTLLMHATTCTRKAMECRSTAVSTGLGAARCWNNNPPCLTTYRKAAQPQKCWHAGPGHNSMSRSPSCNPTPTTGNPARSNTRLHTVNMQWCTQGVNCYCPPTACRIASTCGLGRRHGAQAARTQTATLSLPQRLLSAAAPAAGRPPGAASAARTPAPPAAPAADTCWCPAAGSPAAA